MEPLEIGNRIKEKFPEEVKEIKQFGGQVSVIINRDRIIDIIRYLKDDPDLDMALLRDLCGTDYLDKKGLPDFFADEFKNQGKDIATLCKAISSEGYELGEIKASENTVDWLNAVLEVPDLYEKILSKKQAIDLTDRMEKLMKQTVASRKKQPKDLKDDEKKSIKKFNRLIIDAVYSQESPENYKPPRFEVVYHLYSIKHRHLIRLRAEVPENEPSIDSLVPLYAGANWHERECFDLFGITFNGHPDLRRVLLPEDWEGYPLRKDYPVKGMTGEAEWKRFSNLLKKAKENWKNEWHPESPEGWGS